MARRHQAPIQRGLSQGGAIRSKSDLRASPTHFGLSTSILCRCFTEYAYYHFYWSPSEPLRFCKKESPLWTAGLRQISFIARLLTYRDPIRATTMPFEFLWSLCFCFFLSGFLWFCLWLNGHSSYHVLFRSWPLKLLLDLLFAPRHSKWTNSPFAFCWFFISSSHVIK